MTRYYTTLLMFMLVALTSLSANAYDFEVDGIYYTVIDPSALTCGASGINKSIGEPENLIIPSHVSYAGKDLVVVEVSNDAFKESTIVNVCLPNTCVSIGRSAFWRCSKLSSIEIPQGVAKIGKNAFEFCGSLVDITIPPSLTEIGEYAFADCENLEVVKISDLKAWCSISFGAGWCYILRDTYTSNPLSNMKAKLILDGELITKLSFDNSITDINPGAFVGYNHLTEVNLNDNIQSIGRYSFWNCTNLSSVRIGRGVTDIPTMVFAQCPNLHYLYIVDDEHELKFNGGIRGDRYNPISIDFVAGDFRDCDLKEVYIGRNLVQPETTNAIKGYYAIFDQQNIDSVIIGSKVNLITKSYFNGDFISGSGLVGGVDNILKLDILPSKEPISCIFENIDYGTVSGGPFRLINPDTLILGRNLEAKYRHDYINFDRVNTFFDKSTNLCYFEISEDVSDISNLNLDKNESIQNISVKSFIPPVCIAQEFSKNVYLNCIVKVPLGYEQIYKEAPIWKNFWNIEGYEFTSSIEQILDSNIKIPVKMFDINGIVHNKPVKGLNIIRYSDGTTEKKYY